MSAVVGAFIVETGARSGALVGSYLTETVVVGGFVDLAGNLAPSLTFGGDLSSVAATAVHLITAFTPGPDRGDFTGAVGMAFTPSKSLTFNKIGAFCGHGTPGSQQVALHKVAGTQLLAVATIDMTGGAFGQWFYVDIPSVTLDPGVQYMLRAEITAGNGYFWPDAGPPSAATLQDCSTWEAGYGFSLNDSYHFGIGYPAIYYGLDLVFAVAVGATVDLAGNLSPSVTLAADVTDIHDFVGDLAVSVSFIADVTDIHDFVGDLAPSLTFGGDLTVAGASTNYVDLAGNLGGHSTYGRRKYGLGKYSLYGAIEPAFAASALDIVGTDEFAGNLVPVVTFTGALERLPGLAGDLAPVITFAGDLSFVPYVDFAGELAPIVTFAATVGLQIDLAGNIAPQISLDGLLGFDTFVDGSFDLTIVFEASTLISGPLWDESEPCPPPEWVMTEPCPPPVWAASAPPEATWGPSESPPSLWTPTDSSDPVEWEDSELCNG